MSFLDKLKVKIEEGGSTGDDKEEKVRKNNEENSDFLQLDVDIFQTSKNIIIFAPIPGVEVDDLDINIENENDVVTIQGKRKMPQIVEENKQPLRQECHWGQFYRQIILPQEVNIAGIDARFKKGILVLTLPLLRLQVKGKKKIEIKDGASKT
jgi:HSP20 family protein